MLVGRPATCLSLIPMKNQRTNGPVDADLIFGSEISI